MAVTEKLIYSDYQVTTTRPSVFVPGLYDVTVTYMTCPSCGEELDDITHPYVVTCKNCGLRMKRTGNALYINRDADPVTR